MADIPFKDTEQNWGKTKLRVEFLRDTQLMLLSSFNVLRLFINACYLSHCSSPPGCERPLQVVPPISDGAPSAKKPGRVTASGHIPFSTDPARASVGRRKGHAVLLSCNGNSTVHIF
jgi:hypothetical protein